jgi:molybdate transport system ATP-binding protein
MEKKLTANFRYQHPRGGPLVTAALELPMDRHHITVLVGPSGSGKTTILRCLAGLEQPQSGRITCGDETWLDAASHWSLSPQQRRCGYVFQDYALFPHLTVEQNIGYGIKRSEGQTALRHWLEAFSLQSLTHRLPHEISGGEQQRVALARALAMQPRLLLLDEPLSALDTPLRASLRSQLHHYLKQASLPVVLVTHDRAEAELLADQVVELYSR